MASVTRFAAALAYAGAAAALCAYPAEAGCKRMAFSVNDYGKEGPTKDAQDLLDKHIATWATEQGIEKYTVGKKDVTCELYLNLIVFDEHTCTARATVCWGGDKPPSAQQAKSTLKKDEKATEAAKVEPAKADAAGAASSAAKPAADTKPAETAPGAEKTAATPPADAGAAQVETGTIPLSNKPAESAPKTADSTDKPADKSGGEGYTVSDRDAVAAAAAAAERAAAAAERAAAAAERAAALVSEQVAKAQQQSQGSDATATGQSSVYGASGQAVVAPIQPDQPAAKQ